MTLKHLAVYQKGQTVRAIWKMINANYKNLITKFSSSFISKLKWINKGKNQQLICGIWSHKKNSNRSQCKIQLNKK